MKIVTALPTLDAWRLRWPTSCWLRWQGSATGRRLQANASGWSWGPDGLELRGIRNERTVTAFLRIHPDEHRSSSSVGHEPASCASRRDGADSARPIDLNMGCPVKKVCKTGAGAALLDDPGQRDAIPSRRGGQRLPGT